MKQLAKLYLPFSTEERCLFSVAYSNIIGSKRASWKILWSIQDKERKQGGRRAEDRVVERHIEVVQGEIRQTCEEVIGLLDSLLIPNEPSFEGRTFFWKMKGDYNRYWAEFARGEERETVAQNALNAYNAAQAAANNLPATHPIRLGLGLNFSVFYYEILNMPERACQLSKDTFDTAIANLDNLTEAEYKDSTLIMQLMRDGFTLWTSDIVDEEEDGGQYHA